MTVDQATALIQTFGLAVVILFFIGLALWKVLGWTGREIVIPVRDQLIKSLVQFFSDTRSMLSRMETTIDRCADAIDRFECKAEGLIRLPQSQHRQPPQR